MSRSIQRMAVLLPILLLAFVLGRAEWQLASSRTWHFAIRGYDPRDLLRGHYLRFQLAVSPDETLSMCTVGEANCCYCLSAGQDVAARVALATCEMAQRSCDAFVRTAPLHALHRFYIPEEGRAELERRLRDAARNGHAHLAVAVDASGEPMIDGLLVDGVPIEAATRTDGETTRSETTEAGDPGRDR
jgi:hypothetical protein